MRKSDERTVEMKFFYKKRVIYSPKSSTEIAEILSSVTGTTYSWDKEFIGTVDSADFELWSEYGYRNSFAPRLYGAITEKENGCEVVIEAKPKMKVLINFMLFVIAVAFVTFTIMAINSAVRNGFSAELVIASVMPCVAYFVFMLISYFAFSIPADKALKRVEELVR